MKIFMSSAYNKNLQSIRALEMSFIKEIKKIGPMCEPWETPEVMENDDEIAFLILTFYLGKYE